MAVPLLAAMPQAPESTSPRRHSGQLRGVLRWACLALRLAGRCAHLQALLVPELPFLECQTSWLPIIAAYFLCWPA